jgi:hypothetical protein
MKKKSFLKFDFFLFLNFEKIDHTTKGNWKKSILKIELKIEKIGYTTIGK